MDAVEAVLLAEAGADAEAAADLILCDKTHKETESLRFMLMLAFARGVKRGREDEAMAHEGVAEAIAALATAVGEMEQADVKTQVAALAQQVETLNVTMNEVDALEGEVRTETEVCWRMFWRCCRRYGIGCALAAKQLHRAQWYDSWFGAYSEVQAKWGDAKSVSTGDFSKWLKGDGSGKTDGEKFWRAMVV